MQNFILKLKIYFFLKKIRFNTPRFSHNRITFATDTEEWQQIRFLEYFFYVFFVQNCHCCREYHSNDGRIFFLASFYIVSSTMLRSRLNYNRSSKVSSASTLYDHQNQFVEHISASIFGCKKMFIRFKMHGEQWRASCMLLLEMTRLWYVELNRNSKRKLAINNVYWYTRQNNETRADEWWSRVGLMDILMDLSVDEFEKRFLGELKGDWSEN